MRTRKGAGPAGDHGLTATRLLRASARPGVPWRNGAGITREVVTGGGDPFGWRVSVADLTGDAPFSAFPGIDRSFVLAEGGPVRLTIDDVEQRLRTGDIATFAGEAVVTARVDAPARAINIMSRRDAFAHDARIACAEGRVGADVALAIGHGATHAGAELAPFDAIWSPDGTIEIVGGRVLLIALSQHRTGEKIGE